ncbi:MAG TPA: ABC transporter permease [Thermomicrobiales bacterium]|nr:diguanylate cyclase [Chloroflexota bacterium]HQZ90242.1 ABC transporter permease [Thermomicrobiales bacterium]
MEADGMVSDAATPQAAGADELSTAGRRQTRTLAGDAWRSFRKNKAALIGLVFIVFIVFVAIFAPLLAPTGYAEQDLLAVTQPPSRAHWLGTDQLGRDILSRLIYGSRVSLLVGVVVQIVILAIGVPVGLVAGYFPGKVDTFLMRVVDVLYAFPNLLFVIIIMTYLRAQFQTVDSGPLLPLKTFDRATGGLLGVYIGLGLVSWLTVSRLVRGQIMSLRNKEFVEAARCIGSTNSRIISRHLLPNTLPVIIVATTLGLPAAILGEAGISFLGLGVTVPTPSWGSMISDGVALLRSYPHILFSPAVALSLTVLSFNFVGDGLRDALDPWVQR